MIVLQLSRLARQIKHRRYQNRVTTEEYVDYQDISRIFRYSWSEKQLPRQWWIWPAKRRSRLNRLWLQTCQFLIVSKQSWLNVKVNFTLIFRFLLIDSRGECAFCVNKVSKMTYECTREAEKCFFKTSTIYQCYNSVQWIYFYHYLKIWLFRETLWSVCRIKAP